MKQCFISLANDETIADDSFCTEKHKNRKGNFEEQKEL